MDGTFATDDSVDVGDFTSHDLTADNIGLAICDAAANDQPIGFAYAADT